MNRHFSSFFRVFSGIYSPLCFMSGTTQTVFTDPARILHKWPLIRALKKGLLHGFHTDFARIFTDDRGKIGGSVGEGF